ncbi:DNA mismatch repair protein MutS [Verrucomicrobia bacterium]|nr:DNA mismatch repair protein MutS [Verrucomicrobiota bacterium]
MPAKKKKQTPMMAQYFAIRNSLPKDTLLFFRLGDFYEMFHEDAINGARVMGISQTKRGETPMCGIPYHAANGYLTKVLKAGYKAALCEQVEEAVAGKLVKREVTQILSPGTHFDERMLVAERNNYLASVSPYKGSFGLAIVDLTTGEFRTTEVADESGLMNELERVRPAEVIYPGEDMELIKLLQGARTILSGYDDWVFDSDTAFYTLKDHFKVASLDGFGLKNHDLASGAAGAAVHYLTNQLRRDISHLRSITFYQCSEFMALDAISLRNLEILEPLHRDAPKSSCLLGAMDRTKTPMGARRLRDCLTQPLSTVAAISQRQTLVQTWVRRGDLLDQFRESVGEIRDLERTIGRISVGSGNARDLQSLKRALEQIPALREGLDSLASAAADTSDTLQLNDERTEGIDSLALLNELCEPLTELPEVVGLIGSAIMEEPPTTVKEGGLIADGYDADLDELRSASRDGKSWIARMQQEEIATTGIPSLKVRYNAVFGYFIEVTRTHLDKVPAHYVRKQTIANGERYITDELKKMEGKILGAQERIEKLEYEIFLKVREGVIEHLEQIQEIAKSIAMLDVLGSFAEVARFHDYVRPTIGEEGVLEIRDGRHPVLDQSMVEERFVPNDVSLSTSETQIALITGPNMAGKSTYIRQVALLSLLAHTGAFIPASEARVDLLDRIFTRIGASDDLSRGQSTFMVEMNETANILNNATSRSLVILDEIGRGTSTFDGLSLAWSIVEHIHNQLGAKTLFATHYHELSELAGRIPRISNFSVAVKEWKDEIIFLRKIIEGGADKSYGIQVARLAGVPKSVIERSKEILVNLEEAELAPEGKSSRSKGRQRDRDKLKELPPTPQLDLFS